MVTRKFKIVLTEEAADFENSEAPCKRNKKGRGNKKRIF